MNDLIQFLRDNFTSDEVKLILSSLEILIIPVLLFFLTQQLAKRNKLEEQLNEPKRKVFEDLIDLIFEMVQSIKNNPEKEITKDKNMVGKMWNLQRKILIYGDAESVKFFNLVFGKTVSKKPKPKDQEFRYNIKKLIESLRKNIGLKNPKNDDLLNIFINQEEKSVNKKS